MLAAAVLAVLLAWPHLGDAGSALVAATGALGLTKASILLTVRGRVDQWSSLLWERALAMKIVEATLGLDSVLPPPARERRIGVAMPRERRRRVARLAAPRHAPGSSALVIGAALLGGASGFWRRSRWRSIRRRSPRRRRKTRRHRSPRPPPPRSRATRPPQRRPGAQRRATTQRCAAGGQAAGGHHQRCVAGPSRLLATGGSERVDDARSWAGLPFLIAAVCAALVSAPMPCAVARAPGPEGQAPPSLLEVVATIVAICAGVAGLAAQFVPGVGVDDEPAPAA